MNKHFLNSQQHQAISEEAQLLNNPDELMAFLKNKRKNILENAYIMPHNMREMLRSYLESMSQDFNVGGFFLIKEEKATNSTTAIINSDRCVTRTC